MSDAEIRLFHEDDQAYKEWVAGHGGFILTTPRKGEYMLHAASCTHLRSKDPRRRLTRKPRRWSQHQRPLVTWAELETGVGPPLCSSCR